MSDVARAPAKHCRPAMPARCPYGPWPMQMRADMVAAYMDYRDTAELAAAIKRGEAPPPTSLRRRGRQTEPVWSRIALDRYIAPPAARELNALEEDLQSLV